MKTAFHAACYLAAASLTVTGCNSLAADNTASSPAAASAPGSAAAPTVLPKAPSPMKIVTELKCSNAVVPGHNENPALLIFLAPVLAQLGEKVASAAFNYGYDALTTYLKDRPNDYLASSTAVSSLAFYQSGGQALAFGCIELVRGDLSEAQFNADAYTSSLGGKTPPQGWDQTSVQAKWPTWHLSSAPELYVALGVTTLNASVPGSDNKLLPLYFKVQPLEILYLKSGARNTKSGSKQILLTLTMTSASGATLYKYTYDLGTLKIGQTYNLDYLDGPYVALPAPTEIGTVKTAPAKKLAHVAGASAPAAASAPKAATTPVYDNAPITISANVVESEDGGDFAAALGTSLANTDTKNAILGAANTQVATGLDKWLGVGGASAAAAAAPKR
ncbi:hypothetical protein AAHK20_15070 [Trinickia sp. YCB016]